MEWIVAVPDYAGKVTTPGGGHALRVRRDQRAARPVHVARASRSRRCRWCTRPSRAMIGECEPVAIPVAARCWRSPSVIVSYPYWWSQAAALADQITHAILTLPDVAPGLYKLMDLRRRRRRAGRLAADRPRADGRDRPRAARADLPQGRADPARRAAVRDRAADDRPGPDPRGQRARARLGAAPWRCCSRSGSGGRRCSRSARC